MGGGALPDLAQIVAVSHLLAERDQGVVLVALDRAARAQRKETLRACAQHDARLGVLRALHDAARHHEDGNARGRTLRRCNLGATGWRHSKTT